MSLRLRLLGAFAYLLVLVLGAIEVPFALSIRSRVDAEVRAQAVNEAHLIAASASGSMDRPRDLDRLAVRAAQDLGGRVIVVDGAGTLLADSAGPGLRGDPYSGRDEIDAVLASGRAVQGKRHSETLGQGLLYTAVPVVDEGGRVGAVRVTQSTEAIDDRVRRDVLALAAIGAAALLFGLALAVREVRLQAASALFLLVAFFLTIADEAPPRDLVVAAAVPGDGVPSVALVAVAALVFGLCARHEVPAERPPFSWGQTITLEGLLGAVRAWQPWYRAIALAGAGALVLYGLSLGILDLAVRVSDAPVETSFQRGHTAVSALWGAVGLALLTLGLLRRLSGLRLAGFVLFGVSLAKLFLYDLQNLSDIARALSFLAVGALLLLGGFFYQRLSSRLDSRPGR